VQDAEKELLHDPATPLHCTQQTRRQLRDFPPSALICSRLINDHSGFGFLFPHDERTAATIRDNTCGAARDFL
ncbi:unnamed protein product, partial [Amoebophrya sp. A120]